MFGLDLEILGKLLKTECVFVVDGAGIHEVELLAIDILNEEIQTWVDRDTRYDKFKDYGKTWSLDRKDLE